jgi:hypothetical protein
MQAGDPTMPKVLTAGCHTAFVSIRVNADSLVGCSRYPACLARWTYLGGVQPALLAPLAQVVPLGPVATPFPFLVLDLPPPVV